MVLYPSTKAKAQKEIDELIGNDRLPEFSDRPSLPYLECVVQESHRWHNALPTGNLKYSMYNIWCLNFWKAYHTAQWKMMYTMECLFRKDPSSWLILGLCSSSWMILPLSFPSRFWYRSSISGITLDEDVYKDPHTFDPSRYLRGEPHPVGHFGFGRRYVQFRSLRLPLYFMWLILIQSVSGTSPSWFKCMDSGGLHSCCFWHLSHESSGWNAYHTQGRIHIRDCKVLRGQQLWVYRELNNLWF